jgi:hypothetical protein
MWANTVWGFIGLAAACVFTVIGLSADYLWLRPYLWNGALTCTAASGVAFCWPLIKSRIINKDASRRASSTARFIGVIEAIHWITYTSAWGRWKEAQYRASGKAISEIFKLTTAERFFRRSAENGEVIVEARLAKSVDYTVLGQHFWHSAYFDRRIQPIDATPSNLTR